LRLTLVDNMVLPGRHDLSALDVHPHLGLISLATVARQAGHTVSVYDPKREVRSGRLAYDGALYARMAHALLAERPDAVGLTTLGCSFIVALKVATQLKRAEPELPIMLGGPHATMLHREILERFPAFDVVVRHEAEETLPDVLAGLERRCFEHVPGVSWRTAPAAAQVRSTEGRPLVKDLDTLPAPAYDLYPVDHLGLDYLRVEAGRGCPFACTFCSTATFFQRSYRLKSPQRLVGDLDRLHERYGATDFKLEHDLFTVNRWKVLDFCEAVRDRGYTWRVSARVDCVDAELLERMSEAGCVAMYFGIESGSSRLQRTIKKRLDLDLLEPTLDMAERVGITSTVSLITGYPEEEAVDQDATLDLLGRCLRRSERRLVTQLHMLLPEPGTEQYAALGDRLAYDGYKTEFNAWLLGDDDERYVRDHPDIFATYHYYPATMPREQHVFAVDFYSAARVLGHTVLAYLLRFYGGLSALVASAREWRAQSGWAGSTDGELIRAFIAHDLGEDHHAHSLVRYALGLAAARGRPVRGGGQGSDAVPAHARRYQLGPGNAVFEDLHDCGALIERIRASARSQRPLDDREAGARGCYLAVASGDGCVNYAIDPATCAMLAMFASPRTFDEVCAALAALTGGYEPDRAYLQHLADAEVIVPGGVASLEPAPAAARG